MARLTRRSFLTHASIGAGGALLGSLTALSRLAPIPVQAAGMPVATATEPVPGLIAHVRNISTGEIAVMMGTREVVHRDRSLALHLMGIADHSPVR